MSLAIDTTTPAVAAANLPPALAVTSKSAGPSQKQLPAQAPRAPQGTVKISTAAQTALQESRETPAKTAQEADHRDRQAVKLLAKETASK
jgi:hypothetical protein